MSASSLPSLHADSATLLAELREMGVDDTTIDYHPILARVYVLALRDSQAVRSPAVPVTQNQGEAP